MKMDIERAINEFGLDDLSADHSSRVRQIQFLVSLIAQEIVDRLELELLERKCVQDWDRGFRAGLTHALNQLEEFYGLVHPEVK